VDDLVAELVGIGRGPDELSLTPSSSIPGTPSRLVTNLPASVASMSGRASRQSDFGSDRISSGTTMAHSSTDHIVDR
jgi:dynein intermediate chain, cytosolic